MGAENECLGCGVDFDYDEGVCPACGWDPQAFAARGRYGLAKPGYGEPDEDGDGDGEHDGPSGPPPGPRGLF
jgi:protein PhnA